MNTHIKLVSNPDEYYGFVNEPAEVRMQGIELENKYTKCYNREEQELLFRSITTLYDYYIQLIQLRRIK